MLKAVASSIWNLTFEERPDYDLISICLQSFLKSLIRHYQGTSPTSPFDIQGLPLDWNSS